MRSPGAPHPSHTNPRDSTISVIGRGNGVLLVDVEDRRAILGLCGSSTPRLESGSSSRYHTHGESFPTRFVLA
jgi:hypothetical protein